VALVLTVSHGQYKLAFASLAVPAAIMLLLPAVTRILYPRPQDLSAGPAQVTTDGLPRVFWVYLAAALLAAGYADYPLIAYRFQQAGTTSVTLVPAFYAVAMAVGGTGSLIFGHLFDRTGIGILIPLTIVAALAASARVISGFAVEEPVLAPDAMELPAETFKVLTALVVVPVSMSSSVGPNVLGSACSP
jgi:hypothetical protein